MAVRAPTPLRRRAEWIGRAAPALVLAVIAITLAAGLIIEARGISLGVPLPPFLWPWAPLADPAWAPVAAAALAGGVLGALWLSRARIGPAAFAGLSLLLALGLRLALVAAREGPRGFDRVFDYHWEAKNEYLPALRAFEPGGASFFLDHFAEMVPALPVHAAGHPPGLLLTMRWLGIDSPEGMAALTIGVGVLAVPLLYLLARRLVDEGTARLAALLLVLAPSALHFGATTADALFTTLGIAAALGLLLDGRRALVAGPLLLALGSFFTWALLAVGAWAGLVVWFRRGFWAAIRLGAACALALVAVHGAVHLLTGFDPIGAIAATEEVYRAGIASIRPYAYWLFGSPAAFLAAAGLPIAWFFARSVVDRRTVALALAAVLVITAVIGLTKAETERIWLIFVPLLCLAAATALPARRLAPVFVLLAAQALVVELLFDTVW